MSKKEEVKQYILETFLFTDDTSVLGDDQSFLDQGFIDSTGIMEVIFFLEEKFGIQVEDEEMIPENLDTINNIDAFLDRKLG